MPSIVRLRNSASCLPLPSIRFSARSSPTPHIGFMHLLRLLRHSYLLRRRAVKLERTISWVHQRHIRIICIFITSKQKTHDSTVLFFWHNEKLPRRTPSKSKQLLLNNYIKESIADGTCNHSLCSQLHTTSSIFDHESKLSDQKSPRGAPETIRTSDTRFRRAVLYPLSYEGLCMHNA